jgi:hypothetical protein
MANEAVLFIKTEEPIPFTVADNTGIEKGALLKLTDPMTASAASSVNDFIAGIAASEKIANDGRTKLGVYRGGIFKMTASGAINAGQAVSANVMANTVLLAGITCSGAAIVGHALETAAINDTFLVELHVGAMGNQIA